MPDEAAPAPVHQPIVDHYARCFAAHGATPAGADWPNAADLATRFDVLLGVADGGPVPASLLDLGCGAGLLRDHLAATGRLDRVDWRGIEIVPAIAAAARARHPGAAIEVRDVLADPLPEAGVDYVVMNGVLTERVGVPEADMQAYAEAMIAAAFRAARIGIAFNVMSAHVDWTRDDLFHLPFDRLAGFLKRRVSRHLVFRADYGLGEYAAYVFRAPRG